MDTQRQYPDISDILARKARGREERAHLSFAEKLEILDKLRKQLRPLTLYAWDDLPADVLAERIFHVIESFTTSLTRSVVLSTERGSELVLPPLDGFMPDDVL